MHQAPLRDLYEIIPNLFLGQNISDTNLRKIVNIHKISHVLTFEEAHRLQPPDPQCITLVDSYKLIILQNKKDDEGLAEWFETASNYIDEGIHRKGVLVHDSISVSVIMILAYLVSHHKLTYLEAKDYLFSKLPENFHTSRCLEELEGYELSTRSHAQQVDKVGYFFVKGSQDSWLYVYCVLIGGSLHIFDSPTDPYPRDSIDLSTIQVLGSTIAGLLLDEKIDKSQQKNFKISLVLNRSKVVGRELFTGFLSDKTEYTDWIAALRANQGQKEAACPIRYYKTSSLDHSPTFRPTQRSSSSSSILPKKKKAGSYFKTVSEKVVSSTLGKKVVVNLVNRFLTQQSVAAELMTSLRAIVKKKYGSKLSKEFEHNFLEISVKMYNSLFMLSTSESHRKFVSLLFLIVEPLLFDTFSLLTRYYEMRYGPLKASTPKKGRRAIKKQQYKTDPEEFKKAFMIVRSNIKKVEAIFLHLVSDELSQKDFFLVNTTLNPLLDASFIADVYFDESLQPHLAIIVNNLCNYLRDDSDES